RSMGGPIRFVFGPKLRFRFLQYFFRAATCDLFVGERTSITVTSLPVTTSRISRYHSSIRFLTGTSPSSFRTPTGVDALDSRDRGSGLRDFVRPMTMSGRSV